jgi:AcrR family transcriptional regulator
MKRGAHDTGPTRKAAIERPSRRSRRTRRDLVAAARSLLEEHGVAALTVKAVTDRADVSHGTFYHHFPSTEAVLAAGIEESMREMSEALVRDFSETADKVLVLVASLSRTFRMLASHAALTWMLERPQLLTAALHDACGPFARHDVGAMMASGDIRAGSVARATLYWEWLIVGALVDVVARPRERAAIERRLLEMALRILGVDESRISRAIDRLPKGRLRGAVPKAAAPAAREAR